MLLSDAVEGFHLFRSGGQVSQATVRTEHSHLTQFLRWLDDCDVSSIEPDDIRKYIQYQLHDRGLSPNTVIRQRCAISCLYTWLEECGITDKDPTDRVPAPRKPARKPKGLDAEQIECLVNYTSKTLHPRRNRAIVLFLLDTGARNSEARCVQIGDVGFSTGRVRVVGKGDRERYVFLGKRALSALFLYVKEERPEPALVKDDTVFLTRDGYRLTRHGFRQIFTKMDLPYHVYPHLLRHTAALIHLKNGMSLVGLQHLLGHRSIRTTRGYLDALKTEDVGRVAQRTSPSDNLRL